MVTLRSPMSLCYVIPATLGEPSEPTVTFVLRTLWLGQLPQSTQMILATQKNRERDKVVEVANVIADTTMAHLNATAILESPATSSHI